MLHKLLNKKLAFFAFFFFILHANLLDNKYYRIITSEYSFKTEHFNIYWGDGYPLNDEWLNSQNDNPVFIDVLSDILEKTYDFYLSIQLELPEKINVYVINTDINVTDPLLQTHNISSLGAFTSDDLPEILINAKIEGYFYNGKYVSLSNCLKSVVLHELMHAVQYYKGIIQTEEENNDILWFTEGLAVASQLYYSEDKKFEDFLKNLLSQNLNEGFLKKDYYSGYTAGLFFEFLLNNGYSLNDFFAIDYNDSKEYFKKLAELKNRNIYRLLYDFYSQLKIGINTQNSISFSGAYKVKNNNLFFLKGFKPKNLKKDDYLVGEGEIYEISHSDELKIKQGWGIYTFDEEIDLTSLDIDGIFWVYKDGNWSCASNDEYINKICDKYYRKIKKIKPNTGFWIYSKYETFIKGDGNTAQKNLFFDKGWNLSANPTKDTITFDNGYLVWKYDGNWSCSYIQNIKIYPNEGYWIYKK